MKCVHRRNLSTSNTLQVRNLYIFKFMHLHKKYIKSKNDKCLSIIQDIYLPQEIQTMIDAIIE